MLIENSLNFMASLAQDKLYTSHYKHQNYILVTTLKIIINLNRFKNLFLDIVKKKNGLNNEETSILALILCKAEVPLISANILIEPSSQVTGT